MASTTQQNQVSGAINEQNTGPEEIKITPVLSGSDNYRMWYRAMSVALASKNKLDFVDGTTAVRAKDDPNYGEWKKWNQLVRSWIVKGVSPEIANSLCGTENAIDVWTTLKQRYCPGVDRLIFSDIMEDIYSLRQGEQQDVKSYIEEFNLRWKDLEVFRPQHVCNCKKKCCCCGKVNKQRDEEKVLRFLKGLNDQFDEVRSNIMGANSLPSIHSLYTLVKLPKGANQTAQPRKESKKLVLPNYHRHALTLQHSKASDNCSGCKKPVSGPSYRCERTDCNYILHEVCASAVVDNYSNIKVYQSSYPKRHLKFSENPAGSKIKCYACNSFVHGFVYHCDKLDRDFHPCCLKMEKVFIVKK